MSLYVRILGEILTLFSVKNISLLEMCKYYISTDYANPYIVDGFYNILDFYQTQVQP